MRGFKFSHWIQCILCFVVLVWLSLGCARSMAGELSNGPAIPVNVHLHVQEISNIDATEGTFILYYTLTYDWRENFGFDKQYLNSKATSFLNTIWEPKLHFANQAESPVIYEQSVITHKNGSIVVNQYGQVTLRADYYFKNFPFDTQNFPILITSPYEKVKLIDTGESLTLNETIKKNSWHLTGFNHSIERVPNTFAQSKVSQLKVSIFMKRDELYYITKMYVPLLTFILITCAIFSYPDPDFRFKIPVLLTCLVLISLFSLRVFAEIPPVSYLTRLDHIIALSRLWLITGFIYSLTIYLIRLSRKEETPDVLSRRKIIIRCCFPLGYFFIWLFAVLKGISL